MSSSHVLHICSEYSEHVAGNLYEHMFAAMHAQNIAKCDAYVFAKAPARKRAVPEYVTVSVCFSKFDRLFFHRKHRKVLRDIKARYDFSQYDLLHAHTLFSNGYIAYRLHRELGIPYIAAVRNTDVNVFFKYMPHLRKLGVEILKNAERVVFISPSYLEKTLRIPALKGIADSVRAKSVMLPNGIDDFWLGCKNERTERYETETVKLVCAATLDSNKNPETSVRACDILISRNVDARLTLIGRVIEKKYESLIHSRPYITYIGHCGKEELIDHYRSADIFVMPSRHETFGLVYPEAMSQGLPVIYTKNEGFDAFFPNGEIGFAVDCDDAEAIANAVEKIMEDYAAISGRCVARVPLFDWRVIAASYLEIYKNIKDKEALVC